MADYLRPLFAYAKAGGAPPDWLDKTTADLVTDLLELAELRARGAHHSPTIDRAMKLGRRVDELLPKDRPLPRGAKTQAMKQAARECHMGVQRAWYLYKHVYLRLHHSPDRGELPTGRKRGP